MNYKTRIEREAKVLRARIFRLMNFIESTEFDRLSLKHQQLLQQQRNVMIQYYDILTLRKKDLGI